MNATDLHVDDYVRIIHSDENPDYEGCTTRVKKVFFNSPISDPFLDADEEEDVLVKLEIDNETYFKASDLELVTKCNLHRFEVGDQVIIRDLEEWEKHREPTVAEDMEQNFRQTATITKLERYDPWVRLDIDEGMYLWHEDWLEPAESQEPEDADAEVDDGQALMAIIGF